MDEQSRAEEENQPLRAVHETEEVPILRSILLGLESEVYRRDCTLARCFLFIKIIIVIVACISFIVWIDPKLPTVNVHSMQISFSDDVNNLTVWSATFSIENPNEKFNVTYKNNSVCVLHRRRHVWSVKVGSYEQKGAEEIEIVVKGDETGVIDEVAAREIEKEVAVRGKVVDLDMVFQGRVGFYLGGYCFWGERNMIAVCENVKVKLSTHDGINKSVMFFDGSQNCRVRFPPPPRYESGKLRFN